MSFANCFVVICFLQHLSQSAQVKAFCSRPGIKLNASVVNEYLWTRRRNAASTKKVVKFVEALWRFLLYVGCCLIGYQTLFVPATASWILDTNQHWDKWPIHSVSRAMDFYYQYQLGAYIHLLFWTEVSRSDAVEMIIHHVTTILLLTFSYITNFTRIGASILLLHDASDLFLESAKCFNYVSKAKDSKWACKYCDTIFALFAITFFVTRLIIYPRYIIYSVFVEAPTHFGTNWAGFWVFSGLLVVLQLLHIFWFYLIAKMLWQLFSTGVDKDVRSDDDDDVDEELKKEEIETKSKEKSSGVKKNNSHKKTK
jgi:TLC domain